MDKKNGYNDKQVTHMVYGEDGEVYYSGSLSESVLFPKIRAEVKKNKKNQQINRDMTRERGERVTVFQDIMKRVAKLKHEDMRMFNYILGNCDFDNWILINQKRVAAELGTYQSNISRALKSLLQQGYILRDVQHKNRFRLNPEAGYKGSWDNHKQELNKSKAYNGEEV